MKLRIIFALLAFVSVAASQRLRAQIGQAQFFGQYLGERPGVPTLPKARACQKMCASDFSPCDPIYFKTEDGRCDGLGENR